MPIDTFYIHYGALRLKVNPEADGQNVQYSIFLPLRKIEIYKEPGINNNAYWYQRGIGKTALSQQLGDLIEYHFEENNWSGQLTSGFSG